MRGIDVVAKVVDTGVSAVMKCAAYGAKIDKSLQAKYPEENFDQTFEVFFAFGAVATLILGPLVPVAYVLGRCSARHRSAR